MGLWDLPVRETDSVCFFQNCGILPIKRECPDAHPMKLYIYKYGIPVWKCTVSKCTKFIYLRVGNWFDDRNNKIPFTTAVRFIYCWSRELTTEKFCEEELDMPYKSARHWNAKLRDVCAVEMHKNSDVLRKTFNSLGMIPPRDRINHIAENTWRKLQADNEKDCFEAILEAIVSQYPPEVKNSKTGFNSESTEPSEDLKEPDTECLEIEIKSEPESD